ncbi:MAG: DUF502 domain-containing protein [Phycisphaerales bacterium]
MARKRTTFMTDFRRFFGRGLTVLLPSVLTLWILWYAFVFVFNNVAAPINRGVRWAVVEVTPWVVGPASRPAWYEVNPDERQDFIRRPEGQSLRNASSAAIDREIRGRNLRDYWSQRWYLSGMGLALAILLIYLAGLLLGGLIGRRMYSRIERLIGRVPIFKQIYPHVKQAVDLVIGERQMAFKRVVLVQYPRQGCWSLGFVSGDSIRDAWNAAGEPCVSIFIPSTPTPFTGFVITVPQREVVDVSMTIDEAVRFALTGGVLVPEKQAAGGTTQARLD